MPRFCSRRTFTSSFLGYYQFQTKRHLRGAFSLEHCGDCRDARDTFFPHSYLFSLVYPNNGKRTKGILIHNPSFILGGGGVDKVQRCNALNVCVCSPEQLSHPFSLPPLFSFSSSVSSATMIKIWHLGPHCLHLEIFQLHLCHSEGRKR